MTYNELHRRLSLYFRRTRMNKFYAMFNPTDTTRVLDIGGSIDTWTTETSETSEFPVTLLNIRAVSLSSKRFTVVEANATALPFGPGSFDIAFSNSVIEHVGGWEDQQAFAREARRVADRLWIQTPARSFPIEPHQFGLFVHFFPKAYNIGSLVISRCGDCLINRHRHR